MANLLRRAIQQSQVEEWFKATLYTGNAAIRNISTGLGGDRLEWIKDRSVADNHYLFDTTRGVTKALNSNTTTAESTDANGLTAFLSDGFSLGTGAIANRNTSNFVVWTFLKKAGLLDIITYAGNGAASRVIPHALGVQAGLCLAKVYSTSGGWLVQHLSRGGTKYMQITSAGETTGSGAWNNITMDTSSVTLGNLSGGANDAGKDYVMYVFAHNPSKGIFCGEYTGNGNSVGPIINLGWSSRFILIKCATGVGGWLVFDTARGIVVGNDPYLTLHQTNTEVFSADFLELTATGFQIKSDGGSVNTNGASYIYMAIR